MRRYDTTGSGQVSKADFEAKEMQHFDRLSNGADTVTEDQFAAARPSQHRRATAGRRRLIRLRVLPRRAGGRASARPSASLVRGIGTSFSPDWP